MSEFSGWTAGLVADHPIEIDAIRGTPLVMINKAGYVFVDSTLFMAIVSLFQRSEVNQRE
jgi:hypothetical protein